MAYEPRVGAHGDAVDFARDLDPLPRFRSQRQIERLFHERRQLDRLRGRREAARLIEEAADDLRHPPHLALQHRHLRARWLRQLGPSGEELQVSVQGVEGIAQLVRDGPGELAQRREALLGGEIAPCRDEQLVELLEVAVLLRQLGRRLLDPAGEVRVEPADLRQHAVEPPREIREFVAGRSIGPKGAWVWV